MAKKHGVSDKSIYGWRKRFGTLEMVSARVRRDQVAYIVSRGRSERRACALLSIARSTVGYQSRLMVKDAPALAVMRELALQ